MSKQQKPKNQLKNAIALTGIAIQMGVTIYLFISIGKWLDNKYLNNSKAFLIAGTLFGVAVSLYVVLQQLKKYNDS